MSDSIPILDAAADRGELVRAFDAAYRSVGFAHLVNHGIDPELIGAVFDASRSFHALPRDQKMAIELNRANRGFMPINTSTDTTTTMATVTAPNQSESFLAMCEHAPDSPEMRRGDYLSGPNVWPDLPGFREVVMEYHGRMCELGRSIVAVAAEAMGSEPGPIVEHFASPIASVRLLRYPPHPADSPPGVFGSAPHRDFGCLTFLAQDDTGGLAVRSPSGSWIDVDPLEGAFVVNVGDMLRQWSNGRFLATPHRVVNRSERDRYSIPFFFDPHESTIIEPLPSCVTPDRPAAYEAVRFGDHIRRELEAGFDHHKPGSGDVTRR